MLYGIDAYNDRSGQHAVFVFGSEEEAISCDDLLNEIGSNSGDIPAGAFFNIVESFIDLDIDLPLEVMEADSIYNDGDVRIYSDRADFGGGEDVTLINDKTWDLF